MFGRSWCNRLRYLLCYKISTLSLTIGHSKIAFTFENAYRMIESTVIVQNNTHMYPVCCSDGKKMLI